VGAVNRRASIVALGLFPSLSLVALASGAAPSAAPAGLLVYFGTYTGPASKGIYVSRFDTATGGLTPPELAAETPNPSFLAAGPDGRFLYAVNEVGEFQGKKSGFASAFAIDRATGRLALLNQSSTGGADPCYATVDRSGRSLLLANYSGGSVAALPIGPDGRLGAASAVVQHKGSSVDRERQEGPHAHSIDLDAANRFALVDDLGLDKVLVYRFDPARGTLTPHDPPSASVAPGAGPRHLAFHPDGRHVYVINEMQLTITAFRYDAERGVLEQARTLSTLPAGVAPRPEYSTAEVRVHPSGRFLYGSNRGHDSIAVFAIDRETGALTPVEHVSTGGKTPRNFTLDPTGAYLLAANQGSDSVVVFRVDADTGRLQATGQTLHVSSPVCVTFVGALSSP
jgi:6-phosphogluconolactonase